MDTVVVSLRFAGIVLPVGHNQEGREIVPVKPISDVFGLDWESQRRRIQEPGIARRLGTCTGDIPGTGQVREMVCIYLNRVAAYLSSINPEKVRAAGNQDGAAFLQTKQEEWDDVLHAYEAADGIFSKNEHLRHTGRIQTARIFLGALREIRVTEGKPERKALQALAKEFAAELSIAYQPDLLDEGGDGTEAA